MERLRLNWDTTRMSLVAYRVWLCKLFSFGSLNKSVVSLGFFVSPGLSVLGNNIQCNPDFSNSWFLRHLVRLDTSNQSPFSCIFFFLFHLLHCALNPDIPNSWCLNRCEGLWLTQFSLFSFVSFQNNFIVAANYVYPEFQPSSSGLGSISSRLVAAVYHRPRFARRNAGP